MDIKTPGREETMGDVVPTMVIGGDAKGASSKVKTRIETAIKSNDYKAMAEEIIRIVGKDNIVKVDNCATRLRLTVKDNTVGTPQAFKKANAFGIARVGGNVIQIIIGTDVENVADYVHKILGI